MASLVSLFTGVRDVHADQAKSIAQSAQRLTELARKRLSDAEDVTTEDERSKIYGEVKALVDEASQLNSTADRLLSAAGR